jgi:hypothetical protein
MDFAIPRVFISHNGGESVAPLATTGLPGYIRDDQPTWQETPWPLMAAPDGDLWLLSRSGLFRSEDGGLSFRRMESDVKVRVLGFGKPRRPGDRHTLYAIGIKCHLAFGRFRAVLAETEQRATPIRPAFPSTNQRPAALWPGVRGDRWAWHRLR